jgi:hypothetical protein
VRHDQRQRVWLRGADVQEVNVLTVDLRRELSKLVEPGLPLAPVVGGAPVVGQLLQIVKWDTALPAHPGQLIRPAGAGKTVMEVVEVRLWDVDPERPDLSLIGHGSLLVC